MPEDLERIVAVMRDAAQLPRSMGLRMWNWLDTPQRQPIIGKRIERGTFYLAELNGAPVGTIRLEWSDPQTWDGRGDDGLAGYVHSLAVVRCLTGQGVGASLLDWAAARAREKGRLLQRLDCMTPNEPLCRYYESRGFERQGLKQQGEFTVQLFERTIRDDAGSET
jgi:GNAT superfamily N-acetyltransferase